MKEKISQLLSELDSMPDSTILIPAPDPRFEGHKIRVRECAGPEWLQLLREQEFQRVRRYAIRCALITMRDSEKFPKTRYIRLAEKVLSDEIYREKYEDL